MVRLVRLLKFIFLCCLLLGVRMTTAFGAENAEAPNILSHENVNIAAAQVIERLLVASADATVAGTVNEGIVIVDGNLRLAPEARVRGSIVVLGGRVEQEPGAQVEGYLINIPPQGFPILNLLVGLLVFITVLSLIVLPLLVWLIFHFGQRFSAFRRGMDWLHNIQNRWPVFYIALTLGFSCGMLVLFGELAWETIFRHAMGVFDNTIIWLVRYFAAPGVDRMMISISNLGYGYSYAVVVIAAFVGLVVYRRWLELEGLALSVAGGAVLNFVLKNIFERARPDAFHVVAAAGYSFPSGHAMVSLCFYGMAAFLLARVIPSWRWRYMLGVAIAILILAIGISRIYLGVHYPSDVVAGYTAGTMWLMFSISLFMWREQKRRQTESA